MKKKILSILSILLLLISSLTVNANDNTKDPYSTATITVENNETGEAITFPMEITEQETTTSRSANQAVEITKTFEATVNIDQETGIVVQPRAGQTNTDVVNNWLASVSITYNDDGSKAQLTNVSGYWSRYASTPIDLTNRSVGYGYILITQSAHVDKYPTSNSFSYNTGFGKYAYGTSSFLGCDSTATVGSYTLRVECRKNY